MKKIVLVLTVLLISITISACSDGEDFNNALDTYCDNNPDSTLCTNPDALRDEIVSNLFNTILITFIDGTNPTFCDDYFAHEGLKDQCENDRYSLVPEDIGSLSDSIVVESDGNESDFTIQTFYSDETDAYLFHVSVIEVNGILKITSFTYDDLEGTNPNDNVTDLGLDEMDIKYFMRDLVAMYDPDTFDCNDLLKGDALESCLLETSNVVGPVWTIYSPVVTELATNRFLYQSSSNDGLQTTAYTITFVKEGETLYASDVTYVKTSSYNVLSKAEELMNDFKDDYNGIYYTMYETCEEYVLDGVSYNDCITKLETVKNNQIINSTITDLSNGQFEILFVFDDTDSTNVTFIFAVTVNDIGLYKMDGSFDSSGSNNTVELTLEATKAHLLNMFADYYQDNQVDCATYFSTDVTFDCKNIGIFGDLSVDELTPMYYGPEHFVAILYHHFDPTDDNAYYQVNPIIEVTFIIENNDIQINSLYVYDHPDELDLSEVANQLKSDLLDSSVIAASVCGSQGDFTEVCNANLDGIRDGSITLDVTSDIVVDENGISLQMIYITLDGETIPYSVNLYTTDSDTYIINGMWDESQDDTTCTECPECPDCPECPALSNQLVNEILLMEFFEMFHEDYNNPDITDQDFMNKYTLSATSDIMMERSDVVSSGGTIIMDINVLYDDNNQYLDTEVTYYLVYQGVAYYDTNVLDVFIESDTTFSFTESSFTRAAVPLQVDVETLLNQLITDYMDSSISDATLLSTYFSSTSSDFVDERFNLLVNSGEIELISVNFTDGVYTLRYKQTIGDSYTIFERDLYLDQSNKIKFNDSKEIDQSPIAIDPSTAEGAVIQYFTDLTSSMDKDAFCEKYYQGVTDCLPFYEFMKEHNSYDVISVVLQQEQNETSVYEVVYYQKSTFNTLKTTWTVSIKINSDLTYQFVELDRDEDNINVLGYDDLNITYDEINYLVVEQFNLYKDLTISNVDYCNTYLYIQQPDYADYYKSQCEQDRNQYLNQNLNLEITGIWVDTYSRDLNGDLYGITFITNGDIGTYYTDYEFSNAVQLYKDSSLVKSYFFADDATAVRADNTLVNSWVNNIVNFYKDTANSDYHVCDYFYASTPGSTCLVDRASIAGYNFIGYSYHQLPGSVVERINVEITLEFAHPTTSDVIFISLPIEVWADFNYTYSTYTVEAYHYLFLGRQPIVSQDDIIIFVEDFMIDYVNSTLSDQDLFDLYSFATDYTGGEFTQVRNTNLTNGLNQTILDTIPFYSYSFMVDHNNENIYYVNYLLNGTYITVQVNQIENSNGELFLFPVTIYYYTGY